MTDNLTLTPAARSTLLALRDAPGNVHEIAERTGRSRSGTDKALRELAKAELLSKVDGGDPADGAPARWQLTDTGHTVAAELDSTTNGGAEDGQKSLTHAGVSDPDATLGEDADGLPQDDPTTDTVPGNGDDPAAMPQDSGYGGDPDRAGDLPVEATDKPAADSPADAGDPQAGAGETGGADADEPKICRGCGNQLPRVCPQCWQKTPSYCGTCRRNMPQARRGEPGEPSILPSGLPRLKPGELERLVLEVIGSQPLPHHVGITGWTAQRVAIYLPGRSTGAIGNALGKLHKTGDLELIGEQPMRYQPAGAGEPAEPADADESRT